MLFLAEDLTGAGICARTGERSDDDVEHNRECKRHDERTDQKLGHASTLGASWQAPCDGCRREVLDSRQARAYRRDHEITAGELDIHKMHKAESDDTTRRFRPAELTHPTNGRCARLPRRRREPDASPTLSDPEPRYCSGDEFRVA